MEQEESKMIIIDGKNAIMGRLASYVAKKALIGKEIIILNSDEVIIMGNKKNIIERYKQKIKMGGHSLKGPKIIKSPERILKRTIRGMLEHKKGRGSDAIDRIKCYNKTPKEYENLSKITAGKEKHGNSITLKKLTEMIK